MQPPSEEQTHLLQLLLSDQLENVTLGMELLLQRTDQAFFVRALGFVAMTSFYPEAAALAKPYLATHFPKEWGMVQKELHWLTPGLIRGQTADVIFDQILKPYEAHAATYEVFMEIAPHYAFIYMPLAMIAYNQARKPIARFYLKRMMELDPNQPLYPFHYGNHALPKTVETLEERLHYLRQAATAPNTHVEYTFAVALVYDEELQDTSQAIYWLKKTLDLHPNHYVALQQLARLYAQQKDVAQAEQIHEHLCLHYPQSDRVLTDYACFALYHQETPNKALQLALAAVKVPVPEPSTYAILALVQWYGFQNQRGMEDALKILRRLNHETLLTRQLHRDLRDRRTQLPPYALVQQR